MNKIYYIILLCVSMFIIAACQNEHNSKKGTNNKENSENISEDKIKITYENNKEIIIRMNKSKESKEFIKTLPITKKFEDYNNTEKITYLTKKLKKQNTKGTNPKKGDFAYYKPWGNIAIFYEKGSYSNDLIPLGKVESGFENIKNVDEKQVRIEKLN